MAFIIELLGELGCDNPSMTDPLSGLAGTGTESKSMREPIERWLGWVGTHWPVLVTGATVGAFTLGRVLQRPVTDRLGVSSTDLGWGTRESLIVTGALVAGWTAMVGGCVLALLYLSFSARPRRCMRAGCAFAVAGAGSGVLIGSPGTGLLVAVLAGVLGVLLAVPTPGPRGWNGLALGGSAVVAVVLWLLGALGMLRTTAVADALGRGDTTELPMWLWLTLEPHYVAVEGVDGCVLRLSDAVIVIPDDAVRVDPSGFRVVATRCQR